MKITEKNIQDHIWENRHRLHELIDKDYKLPKEIGTNEPWNVQPHELIYNNLINEYRQYLNSFENNLTLFAKEVGLEKEGESTIRADLLGLLQSENGLCIVEVKKSKQTEREAFTELLAYASHLKQVFAPLSGVDIVNILIAPMESRIVRESVINNLIFERKFILALMPQHDGENIESLKLNLWVPSFEEIKTFSNITFSEENYDVIKIVWEDIPDQWNPTDGANPDIYMKNRMNLVSQHAAQIMEARGIHGFVYATQEWSEHNMPLPNAIVVVGLNPFKAAKKRYQLREDTHQNRIDMCSFLPKISQVEAHQNQNFFEDALLSWSNELGMIGLKSVSESVLSYSQHVSQNIGGFDWSDFRGLFSENVTCHKFNIYTTGLVRELMFEYMKLDYEFMKKTSVDKHPIYANEGASEFVIDMIYEYEFFTNHVLPRLYNPNFYKE